MATPEHLELSDFIKSVHQNLRANARKLGTTAAWQQHCNNNKDLDKYAKAMHSLAVNHWQKNTSVVSRCDWTHNFCQLYFYEGEMERQQLKELEILSKIEGESSDTIVPLKGVTDKLSLLDVGSCYNPFSVYEIFEVTAVDLAPATEQVLKCDFTGVKIGTKTMQDNCEVQQLAEASFDVVVFSLLLEYLPSPDLRLQCCQNAYKLLKREGLLVIITPDSCHVGHNAQIMKSWRFILGGMGFSRIKYEKLPHMHCMAFRKALSPKIPQRWVELHKNEQKYDQLFIPQDLQKSGGDED